MGIKTLFVLAGLAALGLTTEAHAMVKCKAKDGSITYTQTQCPAGTTNADLPEHLNPDRSASTPANPPAGGGQVSSSKAAMYRDAAVFCAADEKSSSCGILGDAISFCEPESNWSSEACLALKEGLQAARDRLNMADPGSQQRLRELCAKGGKLACHFQECPADTFIKGTDQQVRVCAARAGMAVSGTWIKLESNLGGDEFSGHGASSKYLCLKRMERINEIGERLSYRETVTVLIFAPRGGAPHEITVSSLPNEKFATGDAAATAGCAAKAAPRQNAPKSAPRKNPQTT